MSSQPDRRARFESVTAVVFDPLQRYIHRRLDPEDAADAFAETLLIIWRRLDGTVDYCGYSGEANDQLRSAFEAAFGG